MTFEEDIKHENEYHITYLVRLWQSAFFQGRHGKFSPNSVRIETGKVP